MNAGFRHRHRTILEKTSNENTLRDLINFQNEIDFSVKFVIRFIGVLVTLPKLCSLSSVIVDTDWISLLSGKSCEMKGIVVA